MNKITVLLFAIITLYSCAPKEAPNEESAAKSYSDSLTMKLIKIHKQGYINGFSVAIVNENDVLYQTGIGYADTGSKDRFTENTIQNIGSVSKTFIGIALLKAQEMGKLSLDDPINKYLPFKVFNPDYPEVDITLRQLSTHTSTILDTDYYDEKS